MLDDYESEFLGKNLFDYDNMFWFTHDFYYRLIDLSKLIFDIETYKKIIITKWKDGSVTYTFFSDGSHLVSGPSGLIFGIEIELEDGSVAYTFFSDGSYTVSDSPGFSNLVPMVLAEVN